MTNKTGDTDYDVKLTAESKKLARKLGARLVGVASVDRFKNAPLLHSPQGLLPTAKSVVVVATIWTDASVELTEKEISEHWHNPVDVCERHGGMEARINFIIFNLSKFLEKSGWTTMPLPQTAFWRWQPYKTMKDAFAPPLAHRYAAVAAGLGEIGWHTSFMSPEYGPRQRVISLVTEAPLKPDPLYNGPPLCDRCMRCKKACPYDRFGKEVTEIKELQIGEKKFEIPITNPWRCHLCYYQVNPRFLPKKITSETALRIENDGRMPRGGLLMDSAACLAACLPPNLRKKDANLYPNSVARKRKAKKKIAPSEASEKIKETVIKGGMDYLFIASRDDFLKKGIDLEDYMPNASSIVFFGTTHANLSMPNAAMRDAAICQTKDLGYDVSCYLQEDLGYYTLQLSRLPLDSILNVFSVPKTASTNFYHIITALPLAQLKIPVKPAKTRKEKLYSQDIKNFASEKGADLAGITSVKRLNKIHDALESAFSGEKTIVAENKVETDTMGGVDINFVASGMEQIRIKRPNEYLADARSVIVLGIHYPYALAERVAKPPAENIGPYRGFVHGVSFAQLNLLSFSVAKLLRDKGYKAVIAPDMEGLPDPVHFSNRFPAVAAGLGETGWCGAVLTPEYGTAQRFFAVVTDAELEEDRVYRGEKLCEECFKCAETCPVKAISKRDSMTIKIDGRTFEFGRRDTLKCEWAHRFGLVGEEGPKYMGCNINVLPGSGITLKSFENAMRKVQKTAHLERLNWHQVFEKCITGCPVKGTQRTQIK